MAKLTLTGTLQTSAPSGISGAMAAGYSGSYTFAASNEQWPELVWGSVGHSGVLTDYTGPSNLSASTVLIENKRITGELFQENSCTTLTIRNCHFDMTTTRYGIWNNYYGISGSAVASNDMILEDCTFDGTTSSSVLHGGSGDFTMRRCQFRWQEADQVKWFGSGNRLVESTYFGPMSRGGTPTPTSTPGSTVHSDLLQALGVTGNMTFRGCTVDQPCIQAWTQQGLKVDIPADNWLQDRMDWVGWTGDRIFRSTQGFFLDDNTSGPLLIEHCHFRKGPSTMIHGESGGTASSVVTIRDTIWYPQWIRITMDGPGISRVDGGNNVWGASGQDVNGVYRTAGTAVF